MLLHQEGTSQGLLQQCPGLLPHVTHDGELRLPDVLPAASLRSRGGGQRSSRKILHGLAELVPPRPQANAAGRHPGSDVLQLLPLHIVEWAALQGHLVASQLDPVCTVVHPTIQGHVVAGHINIELTTRKLGNVI